LRRRLGERRIGHAGTLDPDATGVLVVAVGMATRLLQFATATTKTYTGEVVLGIETDTLDAAGQVTATHEMGAIAIDDVRRVVDENLLGDIEQVPPMVSAIRVEGRRLHELAREGIEVERAARPVTIHRFAVEPGPEPHVLRIEVECSAGTYIRSLAADLGHFLGGGAHLRNLRRTASGSFTIDRAAPPDTCQLLPVATVVESLAAVTVDEATASRVATGQVLDRWDGDGPWAVFAPGAALLAVYESHRAATAKPVVVLPTAAAG
jgi:tRNA pseudouridine55 synthase